MDDMTRITILLLYLRTPYIMDEFAHPLRRSTQEALDKLTNPNRQAVLSNSAWYTSGIDFWFGIELFEAWWKVANIFQFLCAGSGSLCKIPRTFGKAQASR
jgi:hypothetical protein